MAQAKPKSNSVATSTFDLDKGILTIKVIGALGDKKDGEVVFDARAFVGPVGYDGLNANGKRAVLHGINQRLMDRAAIGRDSTTGKSATPHEKYVAIKDLADHYANGGAWEMKSGLKPLNRAVLYAAVAAVRGRKPEDVEVLYRDKSDDVLRTLLTVDAIAAEYAKRTTVAKSDEADKLLAELDAADKIENADDVQSLHEPAVQ